MKKYFLILLAVLSANICFAQSNVANLKRELAHATTDTGRALIMAKLCFTYNYDLNPDSALYYGEAAYNLARKIHFPRGEVLALGFESFIQGSLGNLPLSMELGFKALQIAKDNHVEQFSGPALQTVSNGYMTINDYPKALDYLKQMHSLGGNTDMAYSSGGISLVYSMLNKPDSARYYLKQSDSIFRSMGVQEAGIAARFGDIEMKSGNYTAAMNFYRKAIAEALQNKEVRAYSDIYTDMAEVYKNTNQADSAIFYAKKGLVIAKQKNQQAETLNAAALLAELYEPTNAKTALGYYKMADAVKDILYGSGRTLQAIQTIIQQQQQHQRELEAEKIAYKNQVKQYALFAGLGALLLVAIILFRNNRNKRKVNALLSKQKDEIQNTLSELKSTQKQLIQSEKMASLGELTAGIAHEIQNPLNFVNNFSDVNKELIAEMDQEIDKGNIQEVKEIAKDIKENEEKINHHGKRADAIVKGMLQHSRTSKGVKEPTDINALADEYLRLSYHGLRAMDKSFNADMKTDFDESIGKINVVPQDIGRVLLNLFNNSFYAVNEQKNKNLNLRKEVTPFEKVSPLYEPTVSVTTKKSEGHVIITVSDNGNGMPQKLVDKIFQPFFTTKPTGQGTGLGLSLSYDIVKAHGGEIKVESKEGEGTKLIITLPIK